MECSVWITIKFLFCARYSRLYRIYWFNINNRLVFKIKDGCKLALQMPKTIKLFDSTKDKKTNKNR